MHYIRWAAAVACLFTLPALAADPASGKISHAQPAAEWSGELLTPNPGGSDVPVICEEGTPTCDVYRFEAELPDANLDDDLITIKLEWSAPAEQVDIDIYVYDDTTGEELGSGTAAGGGAEATFIPAVSGKYRVVVIPWAAAAQSYTGVVRYEKFEEGKSALDFAGAFGAGTLLLLAGLGAGLRRAVR